MSIPFRERQLLRQRARALRAADPHLAAMLAVFAQITATEVLPATEQIRSRWPRLLLAAAGVAAGLAAGAAVSTVRLIRAAARGVRRGVVSCAIGLGACCHWLSGAGAARHPPAPSARQ